MNDAELKRILAETLEDRRLSRGERTALRAVVAEANLDERRLAVMRHHAFDMAKAALSRRDDIQVVEWLEDVVKALLPAAPPSSLAEVHFSPGEACLDGLLRVLRNAGRAADICVFTITDNRVSRAIVDAHERGVSVRVLTDDDKAGDLGSDAADLAARGIPVRYDHSPHHMHHKFAVLDRKIIVTGSYNWTRSAAEFNRENVLITDDPRLVAPYSDAFDRLWEEMAGP